MIQTQQALQTCTVLNSLKIEDLKQKKPYNHPYFNKKLDGEQSSSYYAQVGICPTKIESKKECIKKGYLWMGNPLFKKPSKDRGPDTKDGSCFRGRYSYIDNKPGLAIGNIKSMKGLIPSLINNLNQMSPNQLVYAAMGYGIPGLELQKCEEFIGNRQNSLIDFYIKIILIIISFFLIIHFLIKRN